MPDTSKFTVACANLWCHLQRPPSNTARSDLRNVGEPNAACLALGSLGGRLASGLWQRQMRQGLRSLPNGPQNGVERIRISEAHDRGLISPLGHSAAATVRRARQTRAGSAADPIRLRRAKTVVSSPCFFSSGQAPERVAGRSTQVFMLDSMTFGWPNLALLNCLI
jgi:hypothetical protein